MTRPRFVKATPADGELRRWQVWEGRYNHGLVVLREVPNAGDKWFAYPDGDPARVLRHPYPATRPARWFWTRREAGNALILDWQARQEATQ